MNDEPTPFIDCWNAVDAALLKFFGTDTADAGIEAELIASAQEEGQTPEDFARWYGEKYDLIYREEWQGLRVPGIKAPSESGQVFRVPVKLFASPTSSALPAHCKPVPRTACATASRCIFAANGALSREGPQGEF